MSNSDTVRPRVVIEEVMVTANISLVLFAEHSGKCLALIHSFNNSFVRELLSPLLYIEGN